MFTHSAFTFTKATFHWTCDSPNTACFKIINNSMIKTIIGLITFQIFDVKLKLPVQSSYFASFCLLWVCKCGTSGRHNYFYKQTPWFIQLSLKNYVQNYFVPIITSAPIINTSIITLAHVLSTHNFACRKAISYFDILFLRIDH